MNQTLSITTVVACCATLLISSAARAGDEKAYHASQCQAADGRDTDFNKSEYRITRTGNVGSGVLMCPVVRDVFGCDALIGGCVVGSEARVRVYDGQLTGDVRCSFSARDETGSYTYYSSDKTHLAPGHDTLVMSGGWPVGKGTFSLMCSMPTNDSAGYSKIFGYWVHEKS